MSRGALRTAQTTRQHGNTRPRRSAVAGAGALHGRGQSRPPDDGAAVGGGGRRDDGDDKRPEQARARPIRRTGRDGSSAGVCPGDPDCRSWKRKGVEGRRKAEGRGSGGRGEARGEGGGCQRGFQ